MQESRHLYEPKKGAPLLPNFLIIGAQKSGTTALAYSLRKHPQVFLPKAKEAHHFGTAAAEDVGGSAYQEFFKDWCGQPHIGEATPNYLTMANAPQQIADALPHVKLIVSLRNPVDRAYSAYWHAYREGAVRGSFEEAIASHSKFTLGRRWSGLIENGRYHRHLASYLAHFARERIHVMLHEDLLGQPSEVLHALATFLGLGGPPLCVAPRQQNQASRSSLPTFLRPLTARYWPQLHERTLTPFIPPPMRAETRETLCHLYRPDNENLAEWLGRDLSAWSR